MRAGLPQKEPEILARWQKIGLYERLREKAKGREKFVLHDGPPYANGAIHIGHALNKTLKDLVTRSQQMLNKDSNYVPGWDCHGLPIEWKIEEENYRSKGKAKPTCATASRSSPSASECRAYADHWVNVQREEFKRLGVVGDWEHPYTTMTFDGGSADRARTDEIRRQRHALSRLQARDVVGGGEDRARGSRGRIRGATSDTVWVAFPVDARAAISAKPRRRDAARRFGRHLDDDALDHSRQSRCQLFIAHPVRSL